MRIIIRNALFLLLIACPLAASAAKAGGDPPEEPVATVPGDPGPRMIGCSATCEVQQAPKRELSCTASGPGARCNNPRPRVAECTEPGPPAVTMTCNCGGNPPGCS